MTITKEQLEERRKTIGGSDIGSILGENKYRTAYEVWEEKVEGKTLDLSKNKAVVIGNLLEHALIEKYSKIKGVNYAVYDTTVFHKEHKFLSANIDGLALFEDLNVKNIIEIKTTSIFNKDDWGPSGSQIVPSSYYAQIAHYMLVTGYKEADIFAGFIDDKSIGEILCEMNSAIIEGRPYNFSEIVDKMETRLYTFYSDEEVENLIFESATSFYNNHMKPWIENGVKNPPPMDFSNKHFQDCLKKKYSISEGSEIKLPSEFIEVKNKYISAINQSKMYDKIAQEEKSKILVAMQNSEKALLNDGSYFLRKPVKRKEFTVKESEYIKFEFKQPRDNKGDI